MPVHDWTTVMAGVFHDFHSSWITHLKEALNTGILPDECYALAEQTIGGMGPDVLTLTGNGHGGTEASPAPLSGNGGVCTVTAAPPRVQRTMATAAGPFGRRQRRVVVRHVSGDHILAIIEIVSPSN